MKSNYIRRYILLYYNEVSKYLNLGRKKGGGDNKELVWKKGRELVREMPV